MIVDCACPFFCHRKTRPMIERGCAALRTERKQRLSERLDVRVYAVHFCFMGSGGIL